MSDHPHEPVDPTVEALTTALREAEARMRLAHEATAVGTWSCDVETGRLETDAAMRLMHGLAPDQAMVTLQDTARFVHPADIPGGRQRFAQSRDNGGSFRYEYRVVLPNGETRWVASLSKRVEGTSTLIGIVQDVTERKRAEEAVRASEARLRMMIDNAQHGLWDWDIVTGREDLDDRWYAILGYAPGEIPATYNFWEDGIHPDDKEPVLGVLRQHLDDNTPLYDVDYRGRTKDNRWVWINTRGRVYQRDAQGRPLRMMGTIHDITPRKLEEAQRERLEAELRHAQKLDSLGMLAGGVAHDFNNVLTAILCNASLALAEVPSDSPTRAKLEAIHTVARRAADLTEQMMAYGGRTAPTRETFRFDTLVADMVTLVKSNVSKKIDLRVELEPSIVEGEAAQIQQVVMNLLTNASEAVGSRSGIVRVHGRVRHVESHELRSPFVPDTPAAGRFACLDVEDSGDGIDDDAISRIFDPFFTTKFAGRGLGLSAVLGIVRGHRGSITVRSTPGRGCVFHVFLPAATIGPAHAKPVGRAPCRRVAPRTILVIDDEAVVRVAIQAVLEAAGCRVLVAGDGGEGVQMFERHRGEIDAVLVDLTMPVMDGTEVIAFLRERTTDLPVLLMSGYRPPTRSDHPEQLGHVEFIRKPIDPNTLVARLDRLCGIGSSRAATVSDRLERPPISAA